MRQFILFIKSRRAHPIFAKIWECITVIILMIEGHFFIGNSELLAAMLVCQFTVVTFDVSTPNKRVDWLLKREAFT